MRERETDTHLTDEVVFRCRSGKKELFDPDSDVINTDEKDGVFYGRNCALGSDRKSEGCSHCAFNPIFAKGADLRVTQKGVTAQASFHSKDFMDLFIGQRIDHSQTPITGVF